MGGVGRVWALIGDDVVVVCRENRKVVRLRREMGIMLIEAQVNPWGADLNASGRREGEAIFEARRLVCG